MDENQQEFIKIAYRLFFDYCTAMCRADVYTYLKTVPEFTEAQCIKWSDNTIELIRAFKFGEQENHVKAIESICAHWAEQVKQPQQRF